MMTGLSPMTMETSMCSSLGYAPNGELYRETRDLSLSLDLEVTIFSDKPMKYT